MTSKNMSLLAKTCKFRESAPKHLEQATDETLAILHTEAKMYSLDTPTTDLSVFRSYAKLIGSNDETNGDFIAASRVLRTEVESEILKRFFSKHRPRIDKYCSDH